jgi:hypothetical protein
MAKRSNNDQWKQLGLLGSLGINLGLMLVGGFFLGNILEKNYHWPNMKIIGIFTGLALGFYELFIIAYRAGRKK